jgi:hypothetical protein
MKPSLLKLSAATAAGCAVFLAGCTGGSTAKLPIQQAAAKSTAWNWEEYPRVTRMRLGLLQCQLQPKSMITMYSPLLGTLKVYVHNPQTNLTKGTLWAEFEPDIFIAEGKSLQEAGVRLTERERIQTEIEIPKQKLQLERQIEESQRQVALLHILTTNKHLADLAFTIGDKDNPLRPDSLIKSEAELMLLTKSMDYLETTNSLIAGDLSALHDDWERRKLEFEHRQTQARFKMPFDGRLTVNLPLTEGVNEYPVMAGQELGVARDYSAVRLRVAVANSAWTSLPADKMSALIRLPSGEELIASFVYQKIEKFQNREESVYYFQFPPEKSEVASRMIGSTVACELWIDLVQPVRVVPKMALVMYKPDALQNRTWSHGLITAFPGASLAVEGQTDLGVLLADGMIKK